MKKKKHSTLWKNITVVLQLVCSVVLVISSFLVAFLNQKHMMDSDNLTSQTFEESRYFNQVFHEKMDELIGFLEIREKFETDGTYDSGKIVNVIRYARNGSILSSDDFWQMESLYMDGVEADQETNAQLNSYAYTIGGDPDGNEIYLDPDVGFIFENYTLGDMVSWSKEGYIQYAGKVEEKYSTIYGWTIQEGLDEDILDQRQADVLYDALASTLEKLGQEEMTYMKGLNEFEDDGTNLTYYYHDDKATYTNMSGEVDTESLLEFARQQGSYIYCNDGEMRFRTNISDMEDYYYNNIDGKLTGVGNHAVFMVAVDTGFGQEDDFSAAYREFEQLQPWGLAGIVLIILSLLGWLVSLVYLTIHAGRSGEDEKVHLNWLDRVKTEPFFLVFVAFTVLITVFSFQASGYRWDLPGILILAGTVAFIYDGVFLIFYLSMIRRMKAGVLWEYSVTNWVMVSLRRVMGTWKASVRMILVILANTVVILLLCYGIFARGNIFCAVLLLCLMAYDSVYFLRDTVQRQEIMSGIRRITDGELSYKIPLDKLRGDNRKLAEAVNSVGNGLQTMVEKNTKDERMKADLITNVSHDIKTPLTSIINYVNLLKLEQTDNPRMKGYIEVLEDKAQRLRQLTEDLVEVSRISSGNITLQLTRINLVELIYQTAGEFNEKFETKDLTTITRLPSEAVVIMADGRRIWRVLENLYNNVAKYAMAHTRVYVTLETSGREAVFSIKNISEQPLDTGGVDLTERFTRGDESRSTEGSGLGLSIAQNLTTIMGGTFQVSLDGDLFAATIRFPLA